MNVLPEKQLELRQTLHSMLGVEKREAGCLSYAVFCDIQNENFFSLLEEWETREQLEQHIRSSLFGVLLGTKSLLSEPPEIRIYTVARSEGMEAVRAARETIKSSL